MEEEKKESSSKRRFQSRSERIFGATSLKLGEEENGASRLIGSVLEKGISQLNWASSSSPTPPPKPSLLPFPVARHRSHGPHWSPLAVGCQKGDDYYNAGGEDDDEDDDDDANLNPIAATFAKPLLKKEKKALDFSKWKELIPSDDSSMVSTTKQKNASHWRKKTEKQKNDRKLSSTEEKRNISGDVERLPGPISLSSQVGLEKISLSADGVAKIDSDEVKMADTALHEGLKKREKNTCTSNVSSNNRYEQRPISIESEIDSENRARLQNMMPDEIAEAQTEIVDKMSPALLNMLKRRGQDKLKRQKFAPDDVTVSENKLIEDTKGSSRIESDISNRVANVKSKEQQGVGDIMVQNSGMASGSLWNSWSERVEAVRDLRFSLDGTVVLYNFAGIPENERDFLRTEGDPGAAGYTIKEAVALTRSVIPGQRTLALRLLESVLDKALHNIQQNEVGSTLRSDNIAKRLLDWEAVWAFALGPEPELVLALRMCLDDNHDLVVNACVKVIRSVLSCDLNENFFNISEKIAFYGNDMHTAPIFRSSKPEIDLGFLGGFWKQSAKPSNLLPSSEDVLDDETEGSRTVQDDIVVAGQDFTAGLVRMGILPRLRYILEASPMPTSEDCIISILIAIARHSPACANAIMKCQRLVETIVERFATNRYVEIHPYMIKSVHLLRVLAQSDKKNCLEFIKNGDFKTMTLQLYQFAPSLDSWLRFGTEKCKPFSSLMVEQLRLWRVCIQYGYCISIFPDLFSALCLWLTPPTFEKLIEKNVLSEFASVSREFYLVIEALCRTLPNFYSQKNADGDEETWSWNYVGPMIDLALKWFSELYNLQNRNINGDVSRTPLLWVYSAIMQFLSSLLERVFPEDSTLHVPFLPKFIPKIGLAIIKNGLLSCGLNFSCDRSFIEYLCCLRQQNGSEISVASVCCLHGLTQVIYYIDNLITFARAGIQNPPSSTNEEEILERGMLKASLLQFQDVLNIFMNLVSSEWQLMQSIETFGRGGPAPGLGVGWGASGGGFLSLTVLLAQIDARLLVHLLKIIPKAEVTTNVQMINSVLGSCLSAGPRDKVIIDKSLDILLQVPVLKYLDHCIKLNRGTEVFSLEYKEEDYLVFCNILTSHFKSRWLCTKKRKSKEPDNRKNNLETIHEDSDLSNMTEWAHQRLPLPMHWFLSPISTLCDKNESPVTRDTSKVLEVAKCGLFFLLGIEAMSKFLPVTTQSPVQKVPLVWKLHSLSVMLLIGMGILEDEKSRVYFDTLQKLYGQLLDEANLNRSVNVLPKTEDSFLRFQLNVHDSYSTFVELFVEQYAAESYGDLLYGRQVAVYLHRCAEAPVRLATWNALSNVRALELLPPLRECFANGDGYLEPVEENEGILDAYVKSWVSGALDKAATRRSVAYTLALHHLSSFIFIGRASVNLPLRNRLVKSLLRDFSRREHKGMMLNFIQYDKALESSSPSKSMMNERFGILMEACDGNSTLLIEVDKLKSLVN